MGRNKFHLHDSTRNRIFYALFNNFLSNMFFCLNISVDYIQQRDTSAINIYVLLKVAGRSGDKLYKMQIIPLERLFVPFENSY